jgi:hypothetical protein
MGGFQDILILVSFLIEVAVLLYLELKAWKSLYTPLNFLMLPYVIVLLISIAISGNFGFVDFYYPSILLWSVGLLIFAVPSYTFAFILQRYNVPVNSTVKETSMPKLVSFIALFVILLFLWRLKSTLGAFPIGSSEYGELFCGKGFWGHLRQFSLPILMMAIYFVNRQRVWLWGIIIALLVVGFLYNVLGWIIIPCIAGIALRIYTGKTQLRISLLLYVVLGAAIVFGFSYVMTLVIAGDSELDNEVMLFVFRNFIHYLTSGTLGLSVDMENGFPDAGEFEMLIAQVINITNKIIGKDEIAGFLNSLFYNTGFNYTNVRTLFGTIFINTNEITFAIYVLFLSTTIYMVKICTIYFSNIYVYLLYFFGCGLFFMGWFDSYFATLSVVEIPVLLLVLMVMCKMCAPKKQKLELLQ